VDWIELLEPLVELLFEVVIPILAEIASAALARSKRQPPAIFPALPILLWGAGSGAVFCLLWPRRLLQTPPLIPGISLLLAPLLAGKAMRALGERLRARGIAPSVLATFSGGALFAFGMALVRFLWIGLR